MAGIGGGQRHNRPRFGARSSGLILNLLLVLLVAISITLTAMVFLRVPSGQREHPTLGFVPGSPPPRVLPLVVSGQDKAGARVAYGYTVGYSTMAHALVAMARHRTWHSVLPDHVRKLMAHPYLRVDLLPASAQIMGLPSGTMAVIETRHEGFGLLTTHGAYAVSTPAFAAGVLHTGDLWLQARGMAAAVVPGVMPFLIPAKTQTVAMPTIKPHLPRLVTLLKGYFLDPLAVRSVVASGGTVYTDGAADLASNGHNLLYLAPAGKGGQNVYAAWQGLKQFVSHHPSLPAMTVDAITLKRLDGVSGVEFSLMPYEDGLVDEDAGQEQVFLGDGQIVSMSIQPLLVGHTHALALLPPSAKSLAGADAAVPVISPRGSLGWAELSTDGQLQDITLPKVAS